MGERWASIPQPSDSQSDALPVELQSPYNIEVPMGFEPI